jgi:hypothetical protein
MAWTTPSTAVAGSTALTASFWNTNVRDNTVELYNSVRRLGYQQITSNYTASAANVGAAANMFSSITFTADGSSAYRLEFFSPQVICGTGSGDTVFIHLVNGSGTDLARIGAVASGNGAQAVNTPVHSVFYYTPSAGSVTLNIRAHKGTSSVNGTISAGAAGAGVLIPAFFAIFGPSIT